MKILTQRATVPVQFVKVRVGLLKVPKGYSQLISGNSRDILKDFK